MLILIVQLYQPYLEISSQAMIYLMKLSLGRMPKHFLPLVLVSDNKCFLSRPYMFWKSTATKDLKWNIRISFAPKDLSFIKKTALFISSVLPHCKNIRHNMLKKDDGFSISELNTEQSVNMNWWQ